MEQGGTKARKGQQVFQEKGSTRTRGGGGGKGGRGWWKGVGGTEEGRKCTISRGQKTTRVISYGLETFFKEDEPQDKNVQWLVRAWHVRD